MWLNRLLLLFACALLALPQPALSSLPQDREQDGDREEREPEEREEDEGDGEEIEERLREAQREKSRLEQHLKITTQRIGLLKELRSMERSLRRAIRAVEEAEERGEEPEELAEKIGVLEFKMEFAHGRLEVLEYRSRLADMSVDVKEIDKPALHAELDKLRRNLDAGRNLLEKTFGAIAEGAEEQADELGEELDAFRETFERRMEILNLKIELHHARREGEFEHIEELENELRELGAEVDEEGDRDKRKRPNGDEPQAANMPAPVTLSEEEIAATAKLDFKQHIAPLLTQACLECHDAESASGDLDIAGLMKTQPLVVNRKHWLNIIQQLKVRSMPPADADQPPDKERRLMVGWLTNAIENFDYSTVHSAGYEPARRLTHDEYNNTIRDLTGIDIRPADRFPADMTASSGFENSANSLFVQPVLLERYLSAAEAVVDAAWPLQPTTAAQKNAWKNLTAGVVELNSDTAEQVLKSFLRRAFRRTVKPDELATYVNHFQQRVDSGSTPKSAIRDVLKVVLVSPSFLIRSEHDVQSTDAWRVSPDELASRLSYFLWASAPDKPLECLADSGRLSEPAVLRGQVDRMLADPRSETLGSIFASQWLGFADLDRVQRDQIDNPWATDSLVDTMQVESAMLFNSIIRENAPVDRLVDADYTFVNQELAKHYRLQGVTGESMQRVSLTDTPRRGVLGHGSILAVTSFPGRTSPVVRGNWVLSRLLGTPPPPPPPNASEFNDRILENRRLSSRQKLERHRTNPNCYACHSQIDPLGFALEEFEWFGRHRGGRRIDSTGQLPGGQPFKGLKGLSETIVKERIDDLANQVTRKMLSYALGRQLDYYDEATVRSLSKTLKDNDRRLPALIHAIVQSEAFLMKQHVN